MFGLEAQGDWADLSNTRLSLVNPSLSTRTKTSGIGLFTGQIGYAWNASLFYVKGGAAVTDTRFSILDTAHGIELAAASATRWGGTVGVGWEYGFAPNWSAGIEYDHLLWATRIIRSRLPIRHLVGLLNSRISQDVDMVTLRINYRFGWGTSPVVATLLISVISSELKPRHCPGLFFGYMFARNLNLSLVRPLLGSTLLSQRVAGVDAGSSFLRPPAIDAIVAVTRSYCQTSRSAAAALPGSSAASHASSRFCVVVAASLLASLGRMAAGARHRIVASKQTPSVPLLRRHKRAPGDWGRGPPRS